MRKNKIPGTLGVDILPFPGVDIIHDLNQYPWPFEDNSIDEIYTSHFLEHLEDFIKGMEELYRILKPGSKLHIRVPYYRDISAFSPVHKFFFTEGTFFLFYSGQSK